MFICRENQIDHLHDVYYEKGRVQLLNLASHITGLLGLLLDDDAHNLHYGSKQNKLTGRFRNRGSGEAKRNLSSNFESVDIRQLTILPTYLLGKECSCTPMYPPMGQAESGNTT